MPDRRVLRGRAGRRELRPLHPPAGGWRCISTSGGYVDRRLQRRLQQGHKDISSDPGGFMTTTLTEQRRAAEALARINRATALGVLGASTAHELNQPLGAIVASAGACSRWLSAQPPNLDKAQRALERIANEGRRPTAIIEGPVGPVNADAAP